MSMEDSMEDVWMYEGEPEYVGINVPDTSVLEGGYVVALMLATNTIRLVATRYPAKYITYWRSNVKRYNAPDVVKVLVSKPYLQYERIKKAIAGALASYLDERTQTYQTDKKTLNEAAAQVFSAVQNAVQHQ